MKRKISLFLFSMLVSIVALQAQNLITGDTDIGSPTRFASGGGDYFSMAGNGDYLYVGFWGSGDIEVWDKSNPANPTFVNKFEVTSESPAFYHFFIDGTTLYASARGTDKLYIIDVSNPANLALLDSVSLGSFPAASYVEGNYAYIVNDAGVLQVVDLSTLSIISTKQLASDRGTCIIKNGNYLYVGTYGNPGSIFTFDISDPTSPVQLLQQSLNARSNDFELIGNYLYIAEDDGYLQTFSVASPDAPSLENSITISGSIEDLDYDGKYLFAGTAVSDTVGAITVFDLSTPNNPSVIAQSETQSAVLDDIVVQNHYVFGVSHEPFQEAWRGLYSYTLNSMTPPGNALDFDGVDDYVDIGSWKAPANYITVEAWINADAINGNRTIVSQYESWPTNTSYILRIDNGVPTFFLSEGDNATAISVSADLTLNTGEWYHVSATYDGATAKIYVNGILSNEVAATIGIYQTTSVSNRIGSTQAVGEYFSGTIDEVRIWNIAKTNCELQQAMNTELYGNETGLVAYYGFNQGTAGGDNSTETTLTDLTSTHNGTLTNFALTGTSSNWVSSNANVSGIVNYADNFAPEPDVATLDDIIGECSASITYTPTATDACAGTITGTTSDPLTYDVQGTYTVTWTYDDGNGNTYTQTQTVNVDDMTAPEPDVANIDVNAECSVDLSNYTPTATDNCAGTITGTTTDPLIYTEQGTYTVTWTYDDGNGNTYTQTQTVNVDDITAPEPDVANIDVNGECSVDLSTYTPTATDNCAGTITGTTTDPLIYTEQGTYTVTWTYDDGNGNTYTQTQNVVINDDIAPVPDVATLDDVTAECEVTSLTAPTATDNCSSSVTVTNDASLPITVQGTTVVTWTYNDGNGNTSTQTQNVVINDDIAPVPDVATLDDVTDECEVTSLTAPTATDNCSSSVTVTNDASLPITAQGTTVVTWTYDDGNGNTSAQTQNVVINDVTDPTISCVDNQDVDADDTHTYTVQGTEFDPTATDDNCGVASVTNDFNSTETLADESLPEGTTTITWTVTDNAGNTSTCQYDVLVNEFVGINGIDAINIALYPNPSNGQFTIENANGFDIVITDVSGRIVKELSAISNKQTVDLSVEASGIYFIKLQNSELTKTVKIIKQ